MIYNFVWYPLSSCSLKVIYFYAEFTDFFSNIFVPSCFLPLYPVFEPTEDVSVCCTHVAQTCCAIKDEREIKGWSGKGKILRWCAQNYYGTQFIVPIPDPKPIPIPDPCPSGDWGDKICGS